MAELMLLLLEQERVEHLLVCTSHIYKGIPYIKYPLAGVGLFLKEKNPLVQVVLADPQVNMTVLLWCCGVCVCVFVCVCVCVHVCVCVCECVSNALFEGSVLYNYFSHGKLERTERSSITEGIGQGRVTNNVSGAPIDSAVMISDEEAVTMVRGIILVDLFICKVM